ncbi:MAG: 3-deoxy-D-manno-octulosonic acid transferase [Acetobacteraceae bacterium]|nr:3-deoxy-D-manno-octulosonic acid transferase [Acetobacteraceae bacterium]
MPWRLYAALATLAAPALRLLLRRRAARGKEIASRLREREGIDPTSRPPGRLIWLHAASVGEAISILPVLTALPATIHVLLTTGTVTSAAILASRLPELGLAARVTHRFAPLDVPAWAARFLDHWHPDAAGFVESEIWPTLLRACRARDIPTMLLNARISPRSFARWRRLPRLAADLFGGFAIVQAQSAAVAERLRALGAPCVIDAGNLKFAAAPLPHDPAELSRLRALADGRPLWLAASTNAGEEALLLPVHDALARRFPGLLTIIAPRHPERGAEIAALAAPRPATRRALGEDPPAAAGVWVADTLGELGLFYRLSGHAFVGRSLVPLGGQNPIEPARLGCAVAVGPHVFNFPEAVQTLEAAGGLTRIADAAALAEWVAAMLADPARAAAMGAAGQAAVSGFECLPARIAGLLTGLADALA